MVGRSAVTPASAAAGGLGVAGDGFVEDFAVVAQAGGGDVQPAAEGAVEVVIDQADGDLADAQALGADLGPELHGEGVAVVGQVQAAHGADAVGLEAAEGVGEFQAQSLVDLAGQGGVDGAPVLRRAVGGEALVEVPRAGDDVEVVPGGGFEEIGDGRGLVLLVAVHGDDPVVPVAVSPGEGLAHGPAVAGVGLVPDQVEAEFRAEPVEDGGGVVGGAVVDDEDIGVIPAHRAEHLLDGGGLVEDRDGDECAHGKGLRLFGPRAPARSRRRRGGGQTL